MHTYAYTLCEYFRRKTKNSTSAVFFLSFLSSLRSTHSLSFFELFINYYTRSHELVCDCQQSFRSFRIDTHKLLWRHIRLVSLWMVHVLLRNGSYSSQWLTEFYERDRPFKLRRCERERKMSTFSYPPLTSIAVDAAAHTHTHNSSFTGFYSFQYFLGGRNRRSSHTMWMSCHKLNRKSSRMNVKCASSNGNIMQIFIICTNKFVV